LGWLIHDSIKAPDKNHHELLENIDSFRICVGFGVLIFTMAQGDYRSLPVNKVAFRSQTPQRDPRTSLM
jgi:hypothetical protein